MESQVAKNTSDCRVLSVNLLSNCAAIAHLLQQQIRTAINLSTMGIAAADLPDDAELALETIPMYRLSARTRVVYRSAIAFKLASFWKLSALDIATGLTASLLKISQDTADGMCLDFSVEVAFPGWIEFRLSDRTLAIWLQWLIQIPFLDPSSVKSHNSQVITPNSQNLFAVQYAHARCCSLLRLAHQQGLLKLRDFEFETLERQLVEPNPIPWLNDTQQEGTDPVALRLMHSAERHLIAQILDFHDAIDRQGQVNGLKLATTLSNAFETFYSSCRIWGEVKTQMPKLAQARLGLVGITQASLRSLLQDQLGVPAPVEL